LSFLEGAVRLVTRVRNAKQAESLSKQADEMCGRILQSFATHANAVELAKEFETVFRYFFAIAYWRGYKHAKKHYADLNSVKRPPDGRQEVRGAIEEMLEKDLDMPTKEVCVQLDRLNLSASFDLPAKQKLNKKAKTIHIGPKFKSIGWVRACDADCVKQMIYRVRTRLRKESRAKAWMALSQKALPKPERTK